VYSLRLDLAKETIGFFLQREGPDISQRFVLDNPIAFDPVHRHSASVVDLSEGAESLVMGWSNHVNLMACPN
jgi:hypothetical protein